MLNFLLLHLQTVLTFPKFNQLVHQPIQSTQLVHFVLLVSVLIDEVFVAIDNHAKLGSPVAQMIIRNNLVPQKTQ